jgi:hypothetical protein
MMDLYRDIAVSMVCSQSTKEQAFSVGAGRDDVADLDCVIGNNHSVNQQFEQRSFSVEVCCRQAFLHATTECFSVCRQIRRIALAVGIVRKILLLAFQR